MIWSASLVKTLDGNWFLWRQQGVTNTAGPANKSDVVHQPAVSTLWTPKNIGSNLDSLNSFTKETGST